MYRSHGELRSYARRVFALYSTNGILCASHFRLAWYVLWGRLPDACVTQLVFDANENKLDDYYGSAEELSPFSDGSAVDVGDSNGATNVSEVRHPLLSKQRKEINEGEFVRFAATYFDTLGAEASAFDDAENGTDALATVGRTAQWTHFESLAGEKGYVTFEDVINADSVDWLRCPMNEVGAPSMEVGEVNEISTGFQSGNDGRLALLSHAFAILDSDGDGRVVFSDMERYLAPVFP